MSNRPKRRRSSKRWPNYNDEKVVDLAYENASFVAELPGKGPKVSMADIAVAKIGGTKWNALLETKRRRPVSRQQSQKTMDCITITSFTVDEDDDFTSKRKKYTSAQKKLNKVMISHFVDLAHNNDTEDEVDLDLVENLIKQGADINCCDKHGQAMIHEAARAWHTDVMLFFIEQGADVNLTDNFNRTALHIAAAVNYPEMVELLIDKGAFIEATTKGENQTPLHFAARNDAVLSLKALIDLGADIEAKDYKQRTPIFVAAELDRSETAKYLLDVDADATVIDGSGQICMTHMITKMGPVARSALDQFHRKDRANRKQYFYLNLLEAQRMEKGQKATLAKTPLEVIVNYRQLDLIMHPVIMRLIDIKWNQFGKRMALRTLLHNFVFVLLWTILGVGVPWQTSYLYTFPRDVWRVLFLVFGCLMTIYYIIDEVGEIVSSRRRFRTWKKWREKQIKEDMNFCHPKWPEEKKYLDREMDTLDEMLPSYFRDFWNYFDWAVYFLIFILVLLHIIDVSLVSRSAPCCELTGVCSDPSLTVCPNGYVNNANLSLWVNRFFVLTIICLWLRLMKFTRAFRFFGPFIVMLGNMTWDILRFLYLYSEFYIPYACAFWMIFGNVETIPSMFTVDQMLFSLYRITLVDDYEYDAMQTYDIVMAYLLIGTFLGISAILCINLLIALLSDTFQRVYDNANANAVMQQASLMLNFEENLSKRRMKQLRQYIRDRCSPEAMYYDDDLTVAQDADLKKVTIKIKEQMDKLMKYVDKAQSDHSASEEDFSLPRGARNKWSSIGGLKVASKPSTENNSTPEAGNDNMGKVSGILKELTSRVQRLQVSQTTQEDSYKKLKQDIKDVKEMLSVLVSGSRTGLDGDEDLAKPLLSNRSMSSAPSMNFGSLVQQVSEEPRPTSRNSGKGTSRFRKLFGGGKSIPKTVSIPATQGTDSFSDENGNSRSVELVSIPGTVEHSSPEITSSSAPLTRAGLRTAEVNINNSSSVDFPDSSNV